MTLLTLVVVPHVGHSNKTVEIALDRGVKIKLHGKTTFRSNWVFKTYENVEDVEEDIDPESDHHGYVGDELVDHDLNPLIT